MLILKSQEGGRYFDGMMERREPPLSSLPVDPSLRHHLSFGYESRLDLINQFVSACSRQPFEGAVIDITEWGIWPSSEEWYLYSLLRRAHGDHGDLKSTSLHVFEKFERNDFVSLLRLSMLNGWGGSLVMYGALVAAFNHDSHIHVFSYQPIKMS